MSSWLRRPGCASSAPLRFAAAKKVRNRLGASGSKKPGRSASVARNTGGDEPASQQVKIKDLLEESRPKQRNTFILGVLGAVQVAPDHGLKLPRIAWQIAEKKTLIFTVRLFDNWALKLYSPFCARTYLMLTWPARAVPAFGSNRIS
jgi:hypothetical protein